SAVTAELQLRQGHTVAAALTLACLPSMVSDRSEQESLAYARLLLAQGQPAAAHSLLQQLESSAHRQGRAGSLITIYLLQSLAHHSLHHSKPSLNCLEQALCLAAPEGYRRVFLDEGPEVAALLRQRQEVAPEFVSSLLEAFARGQACARRRTAGDAATACASPMVERLSETQLRILRLVAEGLSNREIAAQLKIT